jgi:malonyl-CoA O-methyltransferase
VTVRLKCLPAIDTEAGKLPLVLIHGWGVGSEIWQAWLPYLQQDHHVHLIDLPGFGDNETAWPEHEKLLQSLAESLPEQSVLMGYSLGGMLAMQLAQRLPEKVQAVVTLASNACYVADQQWPHAMPDNDYQTFYQLVADKPKLALKRFLGFQVKAAEQEKELLKTLKALPLTVADDALLPALDCLADMDNRNLYQHLPQACLALFGERDILVPQVAAQVLSEQSAVEVAIIEGAPHAFFISHPEKSWQLIEQFLQQHADDKKRLINKSLMAESFSKAAITYDSVAGLQRQVGKGLLKQLPEQEPQVIVDLGCGTGFFSEQLKHRYPNALLIGLDIAEGMLRFSRNKFNGEGQWLCGDAEQLPLADQSVDLIFSSLALQWCENQQALFDELYRVLKPAGQCWLSTLGPNTLHELRQAWSAVDDYVHVNQFAEQASLQAAWQQADFQLLNFSEQVLALEYDDVRELTRELKHLGAHNVNAGRPSGLMGKRRFQQLVAGYEAQRNDNNKLPASYQVWWCGLQR